MWLNEYIVRKQKEKEEQKYKQKKIELKEAKLKVFVQQGIVIGKPIDRDLPTFNAEMRETRFLEFVEAEIAPICHK